MRKYKTTRKCQSEHAGCPIKESWFETEITVKMMDLEA